MVFIKMKCMRSKFFRVFGFEFLFFSCIFLSHTLKKNGVFLNSIFFHQSFPSSRLENSYFVQDPYIVIGVAFETIVWGKRTYHMYRAKNILSLDNALMVVQTIITAIKMVILKLLTICFGIFHGNVPLGAPVFLQALLTHCKALPHSQEAAKITFPGVREQATHPKDQ